MGEKWVVIVVAVVVVIALSSHPHLRGDFSFRLYRLNPGHWPLLLQVDYDINIMRKKVNEIQKQISIKKKVCVCMLLISWSERKENLIEIGYLRLKNQQMIWLWRKNKSTLQLKLRQKKQKSLKLWWGPKLRLLVISLERTFLSAKLK